MIVYKDKNYYRTSLYPDTDFAGDADYVLDDNTQQELENKIISLYPNYDFVLDKDDRLIDVTPTEPKPVPEPVYVPTNEELAEAISELAAIVMGGMME